MTDNSVDILSEQQKDEKLKALYHSGATTIYASKTDPRFCYTLYVPKSINSHKSKTVSILVSVHGTGRMQSLYRDIFSDFSEQHNIIILAPLFPAGVLGDDNLSGYKYIQEGDIRYDNVLISMVDEVAKNYGVSAQQFFMFGFSGGAHFTHRFTILHPNRIAAASIGAAGSVTRLDKDNPWWVGVQNCESLFGIKVDFNAFRDKPLHIVVGEDDVENWEITFEPGDKQYMPGANDAGKNRTERAKSLFDSFSNHGANVTLDLVPEAVHEVTEVVGCSIDFFNQVLIDIDK
jgi:predicted peptidase